MMKIGGIEYGTTEMTNTLLPSARMHRRVTVVVLCVCVCVCVRNLNLGTGASRSLNEGTSE